MNIKEAIVYLKRFKYRAVDLIHLEDAVDVAVEHLEKCQKNEDGIYEHRSEIEELPKIRGWVARHIDGELCLFSNEPKYKTCLGWVDEHQHWRVINPNYYPELTYKSKPIAVELLIRRIEK